MQKMNRVTIVTVCFNEANSIGRCVESVLGQDYSRIEYIVIDGGSTDGTREYLSQVSSSLSVFISEKDNGIYDAMNKALRLCTGDVIYFLNANDYFYSERVVSSVIKEFMGAGSLDIVHGKVEYVYPDSRRVVYDDEYYNFNCIVDFYKKNLQQQCFFCRVDLYRKNGNFDEQYKVCADYDWMIRVLNTNPVVKYLPQIFCSFDMAGVSARFQKQRLLEKRTIILRQSSLRVLVRYISSGLHQAVTRFLASL